MFRSLFAVAILGVLIVSSVCSAADIRGIYMETRTCQVYTGPCFANAEIGLAGHDAIMAWNIDEGKCAGVDLAGLSVVVVVRASETLAFQGLKDPKHLKSVVLVDDKASDEQREALVEFAKQHAPRACESIVRVEQTPIEMSLEQSELKGKMKAGNIAQISTRKAVPSDCICSNESKYYPPLAKVENFAAGVTMVGKFSGRGLGSRWSTPGARSAYMGTFAY